MQQPQPLTLGRAAPTVPVRDIDAALAFYSHVFGFEKTFENGDPVGFVVLHRDDAEVHLTLVRDHKPRTHTIFHLIVSDAAEVYRRCESTDVRIIKSMRDAPWGMRTFVCADPDGNRIDVGQRL